MRRWSWGAAVVAAAVGLWWALRPAAPATPEARVVAALAQAVRAVGDRKVDEVVEVLSPRFQGQAGGERLGRDEVRRLVAFELLRGKWVSASATGTEVVVDGAHARAALHVVLSRASDRSKGLSGLLPGEASAHAFQLDLEEEGGEWRVVSGRWREISLGEALSGPAAPDW